MSVARVRVTLNQAWDMHDLDANWTKPRKTPSSSSAALSSTGEPVTRAKPVAPALPRLLVGAVWAGGHVARAQDAAGPRFPLGIAGQPRRPRHGHRFVEGQELAPTAVLGARRRILVTRPPFLPLDLPVLRGRVARAASLQGRSWVGPRRPRGPTA